MPHRNMPRVYPWNRKGKKQKRQPRGTTSIALSRNKEFLDRAREHLLAKGEVFISAKHNLYGSRTLSYCYKIKHQVGDSSSDDDSDSGNSNASTIPSGYFELVIFTKLYTKNELGNSSRWRGALSGRAHGITSPTELAFVGPRPPRIAAIIKE